MTSTILLAIILGAAIIGLLSNFFFIFFVEQNDKLNEDEDVALRSKRLDKEIDKVLKERNDKRQTWECSRNR